ncbi:uncharacterized protein LOC132583558 [Heteronotia binoei]|uniref:uncharacterized protein LOC132583558 n=1 Tax=Heteronotia binoei TaxID=13085 RepID=UPI0029309236|nr:uncharacterized protein LOC132583558 [Heteronotia binoei]
MDSGETTADMLSKNGVSQILQGLLEDFPDTQELIPYSTQVFQEIPDSQELIPGENSMAQYSACIGPQIPDLKLGEAPEENSPSEAKISKQEQPKIPFGMTPRERVIAMRKLLNMEVCEDSDCMPPRKRKSAMSALVRAAVYSIAMHCINEFLYDSCEGCQLQSPGQRSHACLSWSEQTLDRKVKFVIDELSIHSIMHVVTSVAYSLKCLHFTQDNMDQIFDLLNRVGDSPNSRKTLETILKNSDSAMVKYVEGYIKDLHFRSFFLRQKK